MSPLIGPILAQLITVGVSDRTEARAVSSDDKYIDAATSPRAGVSLGWKHSSLGLGYGPTLTLTSIGTNDTRLVVFHSAFVSASYLWSRTTITLSESAGYGDVSFRDQAVAPVVAPGSSPVPVPTPTPTPSPTSPGGATPQPQPQPPNGVTVNPNNIRASVRVIPYASSVTNLGLATAVTPMLTVGGGAGYIISGSVGPDKSADYPLIRGPVFQAFANYSLDRANDVRSSVITQYAESTNGINAGNNAWYGQASEGWGHKFDSRTQSQVAGGMSLTRNSRPDGLIALSVYPTFSALISRVVPEGHGSLSFGSSVAVAPVIDPVEAYVDPRFGFNGFVGWSRDRFSSNCTLGGGVPIATRDGRPELNSFYASLTAAYRLGAGFSADTGVRGFWQTVGREQTVPPTVAVFFGVSFAAAAPLN